MATPYSEIYDVFMSQITDYHFLKITKEEAEAIFKRYLRNAIAQFTFCKQDLSDRDDTLETFNITLTDLEIQILAHMMIKEWLNPMINNIELARQYLQDKDFKIYSQANHLKELINLRNAEEEEIDKLIIAYSYSSGELSDLT